MAAKTWGFLLSGMDEYDELDDQGNPRNSNAKNKEDSTSAQTHGSNPKEKDHKKKRHGKMRRKR